MQIKIIIFILFFLATSLTAETYYYSFGKKIIIKAIPQSRTLHDTNITYYQMPNGQKIGVKNEIIIGCTDIDLCTQLLENYPVTSIEKLSDTLYLLKIEKGSNPFKIANQLYEEESVTLAHPNFIRERKAR